MKIDITFKCPDAVDYALDEAGLEGDERDKAKDVIDKFVTYGEYINIEFNLDNQTATVVK